jgi:hypothetical protein
MKALAYVAALALVCACGPGNSVTGTVQGNHLAAHDGFLVQDTVTASGVTVSTAVIGIVNFSNACSTLLSDLQTLSLQSNVTELVMVVTNTGPIATSTYNVSSLSHPTLPFAAAGFEATGSNCLPVIDAGLATSGSITISSINASNATGTFSLSFGADQLTGSFNVNECAIPLDGGFHLDAGFTCQ